MARNQVSRVRPISDLIKHTNHASAGVHRLDHPASTVARRFLFSWSFANPTRTSWLDSPPTETIVPHFIPLRAICTDLLPYACSHTCYISPTSKDHTFALCFLTSSRVRPLLPLSKAKKEDHRRKRNSKTRTTEAAYFRITMKSFVKTIRGFYETCFCGSGSVRFFFFSYRVGNETVENARVKSRDFIKNRKRCENFVGKRSATAVYHF